MNEETVILQRIRLDLASVPGLLIWRNSIGYDSRAKVHYGIQNPGGSDLLGLKSIIITPDMVGMRLAVFAALEVKKPGGIRSEEQKNFIRVVRENGGLAGFAESTQQSMDILNGKKTD